MIKPARSSALLAAAVLALTACSSSSSGKKAAESQLGAIESAVAQGANASGGATSSDPSDGTSSSDATSSDATSSSSSSTGSTTNPASVDACALLTPADANAVAQADKLDDAQTASTVYSLTTTKRDLASAGQSGCSFHISDQNTAGFLDVVVTDSSHLSDYADGTKDPGLGDEAYTSDLGTAVRVGGLLLMQGVNSLPTPMVKDLMGKMADRLK